jgi:hypothetical protein
MGTRKPEIGLPVVEGFAVEVDDILLPALVFVMTAFTILHLFGIEPAVIAPALFDIPGNIAVVMT